MRQGPPVHSLPQRALDDLPHGEEKVSVGSRPALFDRLDKGVEHGACRGLAAAELPRVGAGLVVPAPGDADGVPAAGALEDALRGPPGVLVPSGLVLLRHALVRKVQDRSTDDAEEGRGEEREGRGRSG